jgi:hypothetical protein
MLTDRWKDGNHGYHGDQSKCSTDKLGNRGYQGKRGITRAIIVIKVSMVTKVHGADETIDGSCNQCDHDNIALGGLVVSVLVTGPTGYSVAGSNPTEDGGFLWV